MYWCASCKIPILKEPSAEGISDVPLFCPLCGEKLDYLCSDLRPVFPEERLLLELLLQRKPNSLINASVWASNSRYYIDGTSVPLSTQRYRRADPDLLRQMLDTYASENDASYFNSIIGKFVQANSYRLFYLKKEATDFIKDVAKSVDEEHLVVSFSGGKDSTATADIVVKALGSLQITHVFGDTTLEFPLTYSYIEQFRDAHPDTPLWVSKNYEQDFYQVCEDIGPPARMLRWCCSMFKTGPITRLFNEAFPGETILTFYGIRKCESVSRSKYRRVTYSSESAKIQKQIVASPIFFWSDLDVWLYLLGEGVAFNDAYRLGYDRVGCWCCPNNTLRAQFLSKIYMPEESKRWRSFLVDFARKVGKPDPEVYVDTGKWKARQGGNGLPAANDVKIKFANCTTEDHAKIYSLVKPFNESFLNVMVAFG